MMKKQIALVALLFLGMSCFNASAQFIYQLVRHIKSYCSILKSCYKQYILYKTD